MEIKVDKQAYTISDDKIQDGDLIYNIYAKKIDECIMIDSEGMMCVEFAGTGGGRTILSEKLYKKAVKVK